MREYEQYAPSPKNDKRACMCKDGTYSRKCCDGSFQAQGIGNITGESLTGVWYGYNVTACSDQHTHHVHIHDTQLTVGKTYYLTLENNHNECYTIDSTSHAEGIHVNSASVLYDDCAECEAAN